ncbi:MAG: hypothetical protein AAB922_05785 [Patescibacteria group bacterium]
MKQRITVEQLNELSKEGANRLLDWEINKQYAPTLNPHGEEYELKELSIGQMIEFLDAKRETIMFVSKIKCCDEDIWSTGSIVCMGNRGKNKKESKRLHNAGKELCDALWEAVKEVLEK